MIWGRKPHLILAMADPEALARALAAADGRRGIRISAAPTTDVLARLLREDPGRVIVHPSLVEGGVPRAHLEAALRAAIPLETFLADPDGVIRTGSPQRLSALPAGLYPLVGGAGGVGTTTAALGLWEHLRAQGEAAALLEIPGPGRPAALLARGRAADAAGMILAETAPEEGALALDGPTAAALWAERPELFQAFLDRLTARFRLVVVDLSPDFPGAEAILARGIRRIVLLDGRPEGEAQAERIRQRHPDVLRALTARWGEGGGIPHEIRLDPPPRAAAWGKALARALLKSTIGG